MSFSGSCSFFGAGPYHIPSLSRHSIPHRSLHRTFSFASGIIGEVCPKKDKILTRCFLTQYIAYPPSHITNKTPVDSKIPSCYCNLEKHAALWRGKSIPSPSMRSVNDIARPNAEIIPKCNPAAEQRGIITNGVKTCRGGVYS